MTERNMVHIAASAVRDRETGHVFCAAIMSWPAGENERVFLRDILSGSDNSYINTAGGLAHIVAEAMGRLTRRCTVRVQIDTPPQEFSKFLELSAGSRKPTAHEAKLLNEMKKTCGLFDRLVASIEAHTNKGSSAGFSVTQVANDDAVCEAKSYATAYRDGWPTRQPRQQDSLRMPSPSP